MSAAPSDPRDGRRDPAPITPARILVWVVVGGIGVFLVVSGVLGIIAKG